MENVITTLQTFDPTVIMENFNDWAFTFSINLIGAFFWVIILKIVLSFAKYGTNKLFILKRKIRKSSTRQEQKDKTILKTIKTIYQYLFRIFAFIGILVIFGVDLTALVASAGIVAIVFSFAAQDLLKDVVAGFFVLLEDYYYVGDYIKTNQLEGTVKEVGIRATTLIAPTGETQIVLNRQLLDITNCSTIEGDYNFDFPLAYSKVNVDETVKKLKAELSEVAGFPTEIVGLFKANDFTISVRVKVSEKELSYFEYNKRIREAIISIANI